MCHIAALREPQVSTYTMCEGRRAKGEGVGAPMDDARWTMDELNGLDRVAFVAALAAVFEGPPWIVAEAWQRRPFAHRDELYTTLCMVLDEAPEERKIDLIRAHLDLVG